MEIINKNDKMPFGKFKGFLVDDILTYQNYNYVFWVNENVKEYKFSKECINIIKKRFDKYYDKYIRPNKKTFVNYNEISNYSSLYQDIYS